MGVVPQERNFIKFGNTIIVNFPYFHPYEASGASCETNYAKNLAPEIPPLLRLFSSDRSCDVRIINLFFLSSNNKHFLFFFFEFKNNEDHSFWIFN